MNKNNKIPCRSDRFEYYRFGIIYLTVMTLFLQDLKMCGLKSHYSIEKKL